MSGQQLNWDFRADTIWSPYSPHCNDQMSAVASHQIMLGTIDILCPIILCFGCSPGRYVLCKMFQQHPWCQPTRCQQYPPTVTTKRVCRHCKIPTTWREKLTQLRITLSTFRIIAKVNQTVYLLKEGTGTPRMSIFLLSLKPQPNFLENNFIRDRLI